MLGVTQLPCCFDVAIGGIFFRIFLFFYPESSYNCHKVVKVAVFSFRPKRKIFRKYGHGAPDPNKDSYAVRNDT